jgi:hypothetical protein
LEHAADARFHLKSESRLAKMCIDMRFATPEGVGPRC